jgi:hypothetical protein
MRSGITVRQALFVVLAAAAAPTFVGLVYGCTGGDTCADRETCFADADADAQSDEDANRSSGDAATDGAHDAVSEEASTCDPSAAPKDNRCVLDDTYGVFVAPAPASDAQAAADDASTVPNDGDGTLSKPYATIHQALANLGAKRRIYVCNGAYREQVRIATPVSVYGGLSCDREAGSLVWSYVGGSAEVSSPSPAYALSVVAPGAMNVDAGAGDAGGETGAAGADAGLGGPVVIADLTFNSPNATMAGDSSIGALFVSSAVTLQRVTLHAGSGADGAVGADGVAVPNYTGAAPAGGGQALDGRGFAVSAGTGGSNMCMQFGSSLGGDGGIGCLLDAGFGTAGSATPPAPITTVGRDGLPRLTALSDGGETAANDPGADGIAGDGGAPAQGYGILSPSGWAPSAGGDGAAGSPGQGGAGASDPLANLDCSSNPITTIGGGGGGSGGCGGAGGRGGGGGGGGGASIALASVASSVVLEACVLATGGGGTGGAGGAGQDGQAGGPGGDDPATPYQHAAGAAGGNGSGGSGGAGGTGGISVGVLYQGGQVLLDTSTMQGTTVGAPGAGGAAGPAGRTPGAALIMTGSNGNPGAPGAPGTATPVLPLK